MSLGAPGANRSGTARCGGVTDLIVCIHLRLTLPLPQQRAIVVICSAKAVSAHLHHRPHEKRKKMRETGETDFFIRETVKQMVKVKSKGILFLLQVIFFQGNS